MCYLCPLKVCLAPLLGTMQASAMKSVVGATCNLFSLIWLHSGWRTTLSLEYWLWFPFNSLLEHCSSTRPLHFYRSETYIAPSVTLLGEAKCCSKKSQHLSSLTHQRFTSHSYQQWVCRRTLLHSVIHWSRCLLDRKTSNS